MIGLEVHVWHVDISESARAANDMSPMSLADDFNDNFVAQVQFQATKETSCHSIAHTRSLSHTARMQRARLAPAWYHNSPVCWMLRVENKRAPFSLCPETPALCAIFRAEHFSTMYQ